MRNEKLAKLNGLLEKDFQPQDGKQDTQSRIADIEDALVELAELLAGGEDDG